MHSIFQMIELGVSSCLFYCIFGYIQSCHVFCSCDSCIECKSSHMCEAVQYLLSFADSLHSQPVIFLVEEETCLLSILHVYHVMNTIFHNLDIGVKRLSNEAFYLLQTFFLTFFGITSLIHATNMDTVLCHTLFQQSNDCFLESIDSKCQRFHYKYILIFINHDSRQEIRFPEYHTAGRSIYRIFTIIPGCLHPVSEKRLINLLLFISGHHTDTYLGILVDESPSHHISVKIMYDYDIAIGKRTHNRIYFIIKYP